MQIVLELRNIATLTDAQQEYNARWICERLLNNVYICNSVSKITINKNEETITIIPDPQMAIAREKKKSEDMEKITEHIKQIYNSINEIDLIYNR